jgi:hypothetical protein
MVMVFSEIREYSVSCSVVTSGCFSPVVTSGWFCNEGAELIC